MKLPSHERAVIAKEKLTDYLLNVAHKRGGAKARLLVQFGYTADNWGQLETDIRAHLDEEGTRRGRRLMECVMKCGWFFRPRSASI
jgi:hypothetical protein